MLRPSNYIPGSKRQNNLQNEMSRAERMSPPLYTLFLRVYFFLSPKKKVAQGSMHPHIYFCVDCIYSNGSPIKKNINKFNILGMVFCISCSHLRARHVHCLNSKTFSQQIHLYLEDLYESCLWVFVRKECATCL